MNDPATELVAPGLSTRIALPPAPSVDPITEQRVRSGLVGSAVGDALGGTIRVRVGGSPLRWR